MSEDKKFEFTALGPAVAMISFNGEVLTLYELVEVLNDQKERIEELQEEILRFIKMS